MSENETLLHWRMAAALFKADWPRQDLSDYGSGGHAFDRYWRLAATAFAFIRCELEP